MAATLSSQPFVVSIIGGGLGGVLLGISLSNRKIPFHIYEAGPSFNEISAGLGFGPNALRAMMKLDRRIFYAYSALKTENAREDKKDTFFEYRMGTGDMKSLGEMKMGSLGGGSVLRASFLMEIVKLLPEGCTSFNKRLTKVDQNDGQPVLYFSDGTSSNADVVIGCDGIHSRVRESVLGPNHPARKPVFAGRYLYRGVLKMETAAKAVGKDLAQNSQIYMTLDGEVASYPIENGASLNIVAIRKHEGEWTEGKWVCESSTEKMMQDFEGYNDSLRDLLMLLEPKAWASFDLAPIDNYSFGNITLLGDAAHASISAAGA